MKGFTRDNPYLSLCGLNCGLCPMLAGGYCHGCGVDNQSCAIARCSLEHGGVSYCFACECYPCEACRHWDEADSFITHRRQRADLAKAQQIGIEAYTAEQKRKQQILRQLLAEFNAGRQKTFFCAVVNLLPMETLQAAWERIAARRGEALADRSRFAAAVLQEAADANGIEWKLRRKPKPGKKREP